MNRPAFFNLYVTISVTNLIHRLKNTIADPILLTLLHKQVTTATEMQRNVQNDT